MGERLNIEVGERDWEVLRGLFESRVMTLRQIGKLYFPGTKDMYKKRVQRLKAAGLVYERPRAHVSQASVLQLTKKAFELLHRTGKLVDYPSISFENRARVADSKLKHELEVTEVKASLVTAIRTASNVKMVEFSTWPLLYEFEACDPRGLVKPTQPDAFIRIHQTLLDQSVREHSFFLEVDMSEEGQLVLAERSHCYGDYYRSGAFAVRSGGTREEYKKYGFRVLITCKTPERRNNLADRLLLNNPPVHGMVWITTTPELTANPLGAVWILPVDYRDVTKGTPFDPYRQHRERVYRRRVEREELVERTIQKHAIFTVHSVTTGSTQTQLT